MRNKTGAVVVLYKPNLDEARLKIIDYSQKVDFVAVVLNSTENIFFDQLNIKVLSNNKNVGIGVAQNIGANWLIENDVNWLYFFDQDSIVSENYFEVMQQEFININQVEPRLKVLSPILKDAETLKSLKILQISDKAISANFIKEDYIFNTLPIASGILMDKDVFIKSGGMNEDYFIDWVDYEFDLRIIKMGYKLASTKKTYILHKIGNQKSRKLLFKNIYPTNHEPFREYYIFRNGLALKNKYRYHNVIKWVNKSLAVRLLYVLYENKKIERIKNIIKGTFNLKL